jgi:ribosomal protein S18 acetylase RimI-like enzyme
VSLDRSGAVVVRPTSEGDFDGIIALCRRIYTASEPWSRTQLRSHLAVFPEGQFVAVHPESGTVVGMAASLIILWDNYEDHMNWRDFTDAGMFTNHEPASGRTLYGAEVMVDPALQGYGIGKMLYAARRELVVRRGLLRIRAGARLRGYHRHAEAMSPEDYVREVLAGRLADGTLTFQLRQGFHVLDVVHNYLRHDPESLGYAAIIEWINSRVATQADYPKPSARFPLPSGRAAPATASPSSGSGA